MNHDDSEKKPDLVYSPKQLALMNLWRQGELKRINILEGSVRSGKTWISLVLWGFWTACMPEGGTYLMAAKTLGTLKRNCLDLLQQLVGESNFTYSLYKKEGLLFGRRILLEGVGDARAESKIRGVTLQGAYCDELTLFPEDFFAMLLSRLSEEGARLFATTNPDNPSHWLMKKYISKADDLHMLVMKFLIDDNIFLSRPYMDALKKEYTGVFYDRFILGLWVAAEGAVYRIFSENKREFVIDKAPDKIGFSQIGVDFGGSGSAHSFVLTGFSEDYKTAVTLDEYYWKGPLTPLELEEAFVAFVKKNAAYNPVAAYCDSAEQVLISGLKTACAREGLAISVKNALKGSILGRIRFYTMLHSRRAYKIMSHCVHLAEAFETAVYNPQSLRDERLDNGLTNIDSLDAAEYATENMQPMMIQVLGSANLKEEWE